MLQDNGDCVRVLDDSLQVLGDSLRVLNESREE